MEGAGQGQERKSPFSGEVESRFAPRCRGQSAAKLTHAVDRAATIVNATLDFISSFLRAWEQKRTYFDFTS